MLPPWILVQNPRATFVAEVAFFRLPCVVCVLPFANVLLS